MQRNASTLVLAAGGTGGHIFPAEALAQAAQAAGITAVLMTDKRFQGYGGAFAGSDVRTIRTGRNGGGIILKIKACIGLTLGILDARKHLKVLRPFAVVGFGGYPSFPTLIAAVLLRIPVIIHEQNAVLGRVNRWFAPYAACIATAYPKLRYAPKKTPVRLVGNPVREGVLALRTAPYQLPAGTDEVRLLVLGGSQGASVFSELVPAALALLPDALRRRLRVEQQCRADDLENVRTAYEHLKIPAELAAFFTDMPARLARAHLIVSRAGASSVAEITVVGRPSILVPLPSAIDDHQTANALSLAEKNGALLLPQSDLTPAMLAASITSVLQNPGKLGEMAAAAHHAGMPDAATALLQLALESGLKPNTV